MSEGDLRCRLTEARFAEEMSVHSQSRGKIQVLFSDRNALLALFPYPSGRYYWTGGSLADSPTVRLEMCYELMASLKTLPLWHKRRQKGRGLNVGMNGESRYQCNRRQRDRRLDIGVCNENLYQRNKRLCSH